MDYNSAEHRFVRAVSAIEKVITTSDLPLREEVYDAIRAYLERVFFHLSARNKTHFMARLQLLGTEAAQYALDEGRRVAPPALVAVANQCFRAYLMSGGEPEILDAPQLALHEVCVCYLLHDRPTVRKAVDAARRYCCLSQRTFWREMRRIRNALPMKQLEEYAETLDLFDGFLVSDGRGGSLLVTGAIARVALLLRI
jgi:hypothetical protein